MPISSIRRICWTASIADWITCSCRTSSSLGTRMCEPQMNTDKHRLKLLSAISVFICVYLWLNSSVLAQAQSQNFIDRFDRQLEQVRRDTRLRVDQAVPVSQRA